MEKMKCSSPLFFGREGEAMAERRGCGEGRRPKAGRSGAGEPLRRLRARDRC
jgi:hypothetical protein